MDAGEELIGEWTLVSWSGKGEDGEPVLHGGDAPSGELVYMPSGRMAVQIQSDGRDEFGSRDREAGTATERAIAYSTYNAYCGTFSVPEPGKVVHHVELSIHPDQPGMDKERAYELDGDVLTLTIQAIQTESGPASSSLRWRRRVEDDR